MKHQDVDLFKRGEATTEYNSNERIIFRIDENIRRINAAKYLMTPQGLEYWLIGIQQLELELSGALKPEEEKELGEVRVERLHVSQNSAIQMVLLQRRKLEKYERTVRKLLLGIGLGFTAKKQDDPAHAMMR